MKLGNDLFSIISNRILAQSDLRRKLFVTNNDEFSDKSSAEEVYNVNSESLPRKDDVQTDSTVNDIDHVMVQVSNDISDGDLYYMDILFWI